jgi:hypothetical protein
MMFLLMGNMVFIFYDQQNSKMINFTCINDRYAYLYLTLNTLIIIILSFTFEQEFAIYILTALTAAFVVLIIVEKPYNATIIEFENVVALYLHFMLLACMILLCVVQSSNLSEMLNLIVTSLIVGLILLG